MAIQIIGAVLGSSLLVKILDIWWDYKKSAKNPLNTAVCSLLRDRIQHCCEAYIDKGSVSHRQYETLFDLFKNYKALGGNGYVDDLMESVGKLQRN